MDNFAIKVLRSLEELIQCILSCIHKYSSKAVTGSWEQEYLSNVFTRKQLIAVYCWTCDHSLMNKCDKYFFSQPQLPATVSVLYTWPSVLMTIIQYCSWSIIELTCSCMKWDLCSSTDAYSSLTEMRL